MWVRGGRKSNGSELKALVQCDLADASELPLTQSLTAVGESTHNLNFFKGL